MTPIEQMRAAAERNPQFTAQLLSLPREERQRRIQQLKAALQAEKLLKEAEDLRLIEGHIEIMTFFELR